MSAIRTRSSRTRYSSRQLSPQRRGISIVLVGFTLVLLVGFVSLAVDIGRVRLANAQLQTAADAAARAGADSLPGRVDTPDGTQDAINEVVTASLANPILNQGAPDQNHFERQDVGVAPDTTKDIHFGIWNPFTQVFTPITQTGKAGNDPRRSANAVEVTVLRTAARNSPVRLLFAPVVGVFTKDAGAVATAYITGGGQGGFGFVGLDYVKGAGTKATIYGGVASDGSIDLQNLDVLNTTSGVIGDARPGQITAGNANSPPTFSQGPTSTVNGWTGNLDYQLAPMYPPILAVPTGVPNVPSNGVILGSSDLANPFKYQTNADPLNLTINGLYVKIYYTGPTLDLQKMTITYTNPNTIDSNTSKRLEIDMVGNVGTSSVTFSHGHAQIYAHIYAPQSDFLLGGTPDLKGWVIGKSITIKGNATLTYDGAPTPNQQTNTHQIHLVPWPPPGGA